LARFRYQPSRGAFSARIIPIRPVTALMQAPAKFLDDLPQVVGILFDDPAGLL
jgi:hypothetical protein